jgi:putative transposase
MKRRETDDRARFITFSCYLRLALLGNAAIRDLLAGILADVARHEPWRIIAWVFMPEHVHLLLRPAPDQTSLTHGLWEFKRASARAVITRWRTLKAPILTRITNTAGRPQFWQRGGGYDRNIWTAEELNEKTRYIHHNPVKRGLVEREDDWAWSSARWYRGDLTGPVPVVRWGNEARETHLRSLALGTTAPR